MRNKNDVSYREAFDSAKMASHYELFQYGSGTYGDVLWRIEQMRLRAIVDEFRSTHHTVEYLDFATGTGRIISFMEGLVDNATGIEISEAMAERAVRKVKSARIMCCDITNTSVPIEARYDLITAFRFVLNAELPLRLAALKALAARLRDNTSLLVFNNHGYLWSYRLPAYPFYLVRNLGEGGSKPNYLTHREIFRLADGVGLRIDKVIGCGVFSGKVARMLSFDRAVRLEAFATQSPLLSRFGANQIYVACLK